ncbi:MAG TPA: hypothetical protein DCQ12_02510 [Candidatus Cloacimonas sp.]|jgi:hypothetical protein|nr:hypothetical protein [Candidatus Cloacimonas sp.]
MEKPPAFETLVLTAPKTRQPPRATLKSTPSTKLAFQKQAFIIYPDDLDQTKIKRRIPPRN